MTLRKHHGADRRVESALPAANAEMNITPMIDILLVLLVIFMAALPLSQRGLDVNLPPSSPSGTAPPPSQIVLEYTGDKRLSINSQAVARRGRDARRHHHRARARDRSGAVGSVRAEHRRPFSGVAR